MKIITLCELRSRPGILTHGLKKDGPYILTRAGKPIAVIAYMDEESLNKAMEVKLPDTTNRHR